MKKLLLCAFVVLAYVPLARAAKSYQVTGPVVKVTAKNITVKKNDELWEIERSATTKLKGEPKVGQRVTIHYKMSATKID